MESFNSCSNNSESFCDEFTSSDEISSVNISLSSSMNSIDSFDSVTESENNSELDSASSFNSSYSLTISDDDGLCSVSYTDNDLCSDDDSSSDNSSSSSSCLVLCYCCSTMLEPELFAEEENICNDCLLDFEERLGEKYEIQIRFLKHDIKDYKAKQFELETKMKYMEKEAELLKNQVSFIKQENEFHKTLLMKTC